VSQPARPPHFADHAWQETVRVLDNVPLARDTYRIRIECPEIARSIVPGQFLMLRLAGSNDPLLGRPLALYDTVISPSGEPVGLDIVYLAVGKLTRRLAEVRAGQQLEVWGPLGNGFAGAAEPHVLMIAGGIGQTPFMALGRECVGLRQYGNPPRTVPRAAQVTLCYGARTADYLAGLDDFRALGLDVRVSTDDGSAGYHGLVTELARNVLQETAFDCRIVCCGPEPMMHAVAQLAAQFEVPCQLSLETPMACGIGICFSCVARVRDGQGNWDYRRTCVEGPVFDAALIEF
jgi:dihydroorotate dehydrogenase electron transfer subunit